MEKNKLENLKNTMAMFSKSFNISINTCLQTLLLLIITACSGNKWSETRVTNKSFHEIIPAEMRLDLMFIDVNIKGNTYKFLVDTGAPFCISPDIAAEIGFKPAGSSVTGSSGLKKGRLDFGILKQVQIGSLEFKNITTFVVDFKKSIILDCLDFDGIVGANLMKTAIWQFNHQKESIIATDDISKLQLDDSYELAMRNSKGQYSPYIEIQMNDAEPGFILFDTGSGHFLTIPYSSYLKAKEKGIESDIKIIEGRGLGSAGIFGSDDTTQFDIKLPKVKIGEELMVNVIADMKHTNSTRIGMKFAKGRVVTMDFPNKKFHIKPTTEANIPQELNSFGLSIWPTLEGDFFIGMLYDNSPALEAGLQLRDKIEAIDGKVVKSTDNDFCLTYYELRDKLLMSDSLNIKVEGRPEITLKKRILLD